MYSSIFNGIDHSNGFKIEKEKVEYQTVFPFPRRKSVIYLKNRRKTTLNGTLKENETINSQCIGKAVTYSELHLFYNNLKLLTSGINKDGNEY